MDRAVAHIEIRPESQRTGQGDSLAGRGGRTPRPRTPRRLYRTVYDVYLSKISFELLADCSINSSVIPNRFCVHKRMSYNILVVEHSDLTLKTDLWVTRIYD